MAVAYILQSTSSGKFYIGSAEDLSTRFSGHQHGQTTYTRTRGPWVIVYHEQYATLAEEQCRERQLKSWKSHRSIQELVDRKNG
ncbi:MAG TPA: GIY-YIG nuclease family protein [Candidatus Angelobacter sp.]